MAHFPRDGWTYTPAQTINPNPGWFDRLRVWFRFHVRRQPTCYIVPSWDDVLPGDKAIGALNFQSRPCEFGESNRDMYSQVIVVRYPPRRIWRVW